MSFINFCDNVLQMQILDASHAEQAATVHRQVMEAELENRGFAVVDDLLPERLELVNLQSNVAQRWNRSGFSRPDW